jgi:hypothetical protein
MEWSDTDGSLLFGIYPGFLGYERIECIHEEYGLRDPFIAELAKLLTDIHRGESTCPACMPKLSHSFS